MENLPPIKGDIVFPFCFSADPFLTTKTQLLITPAKEDLD
jgi:hypothetical protein